MAKTAAGRRQRARVLAQGTLTLTEMREKRNRRRVYDWPEVQRFFDAGHGFVACQKTFGFSHTAWVKAIKRGALTVPRSATEFAERRRKYDWAAVQCYYDEGHSYRECQRFFDSGQLPGRRLFSGANLWLVRAFRP